MSAMGIPLILAGAAANGFAEELAMRSYLIPRIAQVSGSGVIAVLLTSLLFASYHLYHGPLDAISTLAIELVLGGYFLKFRRFWPIVAAHAMMNCLPVLAQFIQ